MKSGSGTLGGGGPHRPQQAKCKLYNTLGGRYIKRQSLIKKTYGFPKMICGTIGRREMDLIVITQTQRRETGEMGTCHGRHNKTGDKQPCQLSARLHKELVSCMQ